MCDVVTGDLIRRLFLQAEDRANVMNKERRVDTLHKFILMFTEDIQKELKSREG